MKTLCTIIALIVLSGCTIHAQDTALRLQVEAFVQQQAALNKQVIEGLQTHGKAINTQAEVLEKLNPKEE